MEGRCCCSQSLGRLVGREANVVSEIKAGQRGNGDWSGKMTTRRGTERRKSTGMVLNSTILQGLFIPLFICKNKIIIMTKIFSYGSYGLFF